MSLARDEIGVKLSSYSGHGGFTPDEALALFEEARERCAVGHSDQLGGFHLLVDYGDARSVHGDAATFSFSDGMMRPVIDRMKIPPTEYDDPEHDVWHKGVFDLALNARTPHRIEDDVRRDALELIDRFAANGQCDLVADFTDELPLRAICRVLGFDIADGPTLRALTVNLLANLGDPNGAAAAMRELADFGAAEVDRRRTDPRDDLLTEFLSARLGDRLLRGETIGQVMASLVSGGPETTVAAMSALLYEILSQPDVKRRLIEDPSLIPAAVEEVLRLHPPFVGFYRRATKPVTIGGVAIAEGEQVMMCWGAANRDPKQFENPDTFRLDRKRNRHLSFGFGVHTCIGAPVARMELQIAVEEPGRLPDIELVDPSSIRAEFGGASSITPRPSDSGVRSWSSSSRSTAFNPRRCAPECWARPGRVPGSTTSPTSSTTRGPRAPDWRLSASPRSCRQAKVPFRSPSMPGPTQVPRSRYISMVMRSMDSSPSSGQPPKPGMAPIRCVIYQRDDRMPPRHPRRRLVVGSPEGAVQLTTPSALRGGVVPDDRVCRSQPRYWCRSPLSRHRRRRGPTTRR